MYIWYDDRFTQMKRSNARERDCPSSSGDVVHVFMSSFSETADAENTASITRASVCVCAETACLCHSLTEMQNMQDSYLKCFCDLIFIDTSP